MPDGLGSAIEALEKEKQAYLDKAAMLDGMIQQLRQNGGVSVGVSKRRDFYGLGIVDAAVRWLTEVGEPRSTREIADALIDRGMETRSKNFTATVYATLTNSGAVKRNRENKWEVVKRGEGRS